MGTEIKSSVKGFLVHHEGLKVNVNKEPMTVVKIIMLKRSVTLRFL